MYILIIRNHQDSAWLRFVYTRDFFSDRRFSESLQITSKRKQFSLKECILCTTGIYERSGWLQSRQISINIRRTTSMFFFLILPLEYGHVDGFNSPWPAKKLLHKTSLGNSSKPNSQRCHVAKTAKKTNFR